jgi:hypothetical protein
VVADYRRARALLADQAGGPRSGGSGGSMWAKLMDEIDKVREGVGGVVVAGGLRVL